jgi:hypothetical protein
MEMRFRHVTLGGDVVGGICRYEISVTREM